jgi:hypothetical protein
MTSPVFGAAGGFPHDVGLRLSSPREQARLRSLKPLAAEKDVGLLAVKDEADGQRHRAKPRHRHHGPRADVRLAEASSPEHVLPAKDTPHLPTARQAGGHVANAGAAKSFSPVCGQA